MNESIQEFWINVWEIPAARWVIWISIISILLLVAVHLGKIFRGMATGKETGSTDYIAEFEKMKNEGKLDEDEFKQLKSTLVNREHGLESKGEPGPLESKNPENP